MERLRQIVHRLLHMIPVLFGISVVTFVLLQLTPGEPIRLLVGPRASEQAIAAARAQYGLDQPMLFQYFTYLTNVIQGDLGQSIRFRASVGELILMRLPVSLFLIGYSTCLTLIPTLVLAVLSARHQGRWIDQAIRVLGVAGVAIPVFWLGIMISRLFGVSLGWFPVSGFGEGFLGHLHHLFLPALSTAIWVTPILTRNLRAALIEQMDADYVVAGRSKGLPESYIYRRHVFMNSLLPTLHLFGVIIAYLLGGTVIVETVYAVPGLGQLLISAILGRDYFVVQGLTLLFAVGTILVTLTVDIISTLIDPRVKL